MNLDALAHRAADCRADPDAPAGMHGTRCARMRKALREAVAGERERIIALFGPGGPHFGPFGKKLARIIRESADA